MESDRERKALSGARVTVLYVDRDMLHEDRRRLSGYGERVASKEGSFRDRFLARTRQWRRWRRTMPTICRPRHAQPTILPANRCDRFAGVYCMEPTGFDPVTSCFQRRTGGSFRAVNCG